MSGKRSDLGSVGDAGEGRKRVRVSAGRDPLSGKRRRLSKNVPDSRREIERVKSALVVASGRTPTAKLTIGELVSDHYLPFMMPPRVRRRTYEEYKAKADLYVVPFIGHLQLETFDVYAAERWLQQLSRVERPRKPTKADPHPEPRRLSARTRLHAYRLLHQALARAVLWKWIAVNPLDGVEPPRVHKTRPDTLSAEEFNDYLDAFEGHAIELDVLIALGAGTRRSETAALDVPDLTLHITPDGAYEGSVRVREGRHERSGEVWNEPPKSDDSLRTIALPPWCVERLMVVLDGRKLGPLVLEDGARIRPSRISVLFDRHVKACGLRRVPFKQLRHTAATLELDQGVDLHTVAMRRGHSSDSVTRKFYVDAGAVTKPDRDAAAKMGELRRLPKAGPTWAQDAK